ncbi:MAG: NADH-quinone oxidoreductase subunit J [Myxococcaceae bacterium]|nr:NADH-quinone oxidoreductase subunit J [Myxococcaceae bacterium]
MNAELVLFWLFAVGTIGSAVGVIFVRNPVASAMSLVASFFFLAGIYVLLWAHTIAVLQVLVYAGAIMVLFLFVIMLLSLTDTGPIAHVSPSRIAGALATAGLLVALVMAFRKLPSSDTVSWASDAGQLATFGTIKQLGAVLYTQWLFPFEAVSLLLLVAIVGAVVVAKARV